MLSDSERHTLLEIARETIRAAAANQPSPKIDLHSLPPALREERTCFVTLTLHHALRGCIGGLEAREALALDVQEHAMGAATLDPRFDPVAPHEVDKVHIEISVLTVPELVTYQSPDELLKILRPTIDGVMLKQGMRRATFLPQVWEKIPDPQTFLEMLSEKMGARYNAWRSPTTQTYRYQVEMFEEESR
jgi:AmmeMemoRadiSam system protein A